MPFIIDRRKIVDTVKRFVEMDTKRKLKVTKHQVFKLLPSRGATAPSPP